MTDTLYNGQALIDMLREQIDASKDDVPDLHGALIRQRQSQMRAWAPIPDPATQPVGVTAYSHKHGGLSVICRTCGEPATRFSSPFSGECLACTNSPGRRKYYAYRTDVTAEWCEPHDAHVRARAAQPKPPAQLERRYCACGQELFHARRAITFCGDCQANKLDISLDRRIAAAQKSDADPTQAWGAGATPSYDWP